MEGCEIRGLAVSAMVRVSLNLQVEIGVAIVITLAIEHLNKNGMY